MKVKNYFMLALALFAFAACSSNDDVLPEGSGNGGGDNAADAWFALDIQTTGGKTRALNSPDQENGTADESTISSAKAIFFRYTGTTTPVPLAQEEPSKFMVVAVKELTSAEIGTPGQSSSSNNGVAGKAFKISKHVQYLLLVANPSATNLPTITAGSVTVDGSGNVTGVTGGSTYAQVNAAITGTTVGVVTGSGVNSFMMTNAKGDLEPSKAVDNPALVPLTTYPTQVQAEAAGAALEITLDRVSAKVRVYSGNGTNVINNGSTVGSVYSFGWILNVTNKSFYPISARTKTYLETKNSSNIWSDPYKLGSYRVDPNYTKTENTKDNIATHYNTYNSSTNPTSITWKATGVSEYCLENTQDKETNMQGYTTQVLLRANFAPKDLTLAPVTVLEVQGQTYDVAKDQDWLTIGGAIYTYESLLEWMHYELTQKYTNGNPDNYVTTITNELNKYLTQVSGATPVTIPNAATFKSDYDKDGTSGLSAAEIKTGVDALIVLFKAQETNLVAGTLTNGNLAYYKAGVNYYQIMIKHDNDADTSNNELGEFGVVRNSVYDVYVNSINNPGSPVIPTPDPTIPDEEDEFYLSVRININPWTWYKQVEDL
ncbi:Mfa1 family fimbria major subunit [Bacteroides sp. OttesenSCG-928-F21]|nr:Mfa1 family fimbria major subunit [Bacteroides sp. OttesenSCG-928-F21]